MYLFLIDNVTHVSFFDEQYVASFTNPQVLGLKLRVLGLKLLVLEDAGEVCVLCISGISPEIG